MLRLLHIENVAVIEKTDIEFQPGLNIMTGETGAGKSIVIDAMGAVLGMRTSKELVRSGCPYALVTAVFDSDGAADWCRENDIEPEDGELFIQRKITEDGKNTCRVCGTPVTVSQLRGLGQSLLDIHGQSDGQRLLSESSHREYLDRFAGNTQQRQKYDEIFSQWTTLKKEAQALTLNESEKARKQDMLRYQIEELERANLKAGEREALESRRDILKNAGKLTDALGEAFDALFGGRGGDGAAALLSEASSAMSSAAKYSEELASMAGQLTELQYAAQDLAEQLREYKENLEFSPEEFDELEERLALLRRLGRKYGGSEEEMLAFLEKCREELDSIEYSEEKLCKLNKKIQQTEVLVRQAGQELSDSRREAAVRLEKRIQQELSELSMSGVRFRVEVSEKEPASDGMDEVVFLMSANPGQAPGKISHIASGGELARIMLAMKSVLAENDDIGTMVFDEVDTGVSGIAAQRVGEKLACLSRAKQVICVTHLPQIAVMADTHFEIRKESDENRTYTKVHRLTHQGRAEEIARLTGGENVTAAVLSAAEEQLSAAEKFKNRG